MNGAGLSLVMLIEGKSESSAFTGRVEVENIFYHLYLQLVRNRRGRFMHDSVHETPSALFDQSNVLFICFI